MFSLIRHFQNDDWLRLCLKLHKLLSKSFRLPELSNILTMTDESGKVLALTRLFFFNIRTYIILNGQSKLAVG